MSAALHQLDLGWLNGPMLLFGGPYSNLAATQAMRQRAEELAIPPERVICTGDVVAYCAEPQETVRLVRDWGIAVVMGNCEESLGERASDCGCGFEEGTTCSALSADWYQYATSRVSPSDQEWMRSLPKSLRFDLNGRSVLVVHGGVRRINRFIFPSTPETVKREELDFAGTDLLIGGHCGIPGGQFIADRAWLNAGVIGMPANDGTRGGWYLLLRPEGDRVRCCWRRLAYDAEQAYAGMYTAGLCRGYADTLLSGLWPSMDVLPEEERGRRGMTIALEEIVF